MNNLKLIPNDEKYYEFIRELRFCEDNINGFITQEEITKEEQFNYMSKFGKAYYICLLNETPVGFIGVIDNDIRLATKPEFKKNGIGKYMVNEIMNLYPKSIAKIKINNMSSIKLFESCGFKTEYLIMKK
jgi:ribosomal protein S18 acetylase RimI-like enzyme